MKHAVRIALTGALLAIVAITLPPAKAHCGPDCDEKHESGSSTSPKKPSPTPKPSPAK